MDLKDAGMVNLTTLLLGLLVWPGAKIHGSWRMTVDYPKLHGVEILIVAAFPDVVLL